MFISSTSIDLPLHRQQVVEVLNRLRLTPVGMEHWPVTGENPVPLCKEYVAGCEAFIGIYAHRYGWQPPGYDGKSITELEYDWAEHVQRNGQLIPRFCFIMQAEHPVTIGMEESDPDPAVAAARKARLEAFKTRVKTKHVGFFKNEYDLGKQVLHALMEWLKTVYPEHAASLCNQVPPPPHFAGRQAELQRLSEQLAAPNGKAAITPAVTLQGTGGIGKTTLAQYFAHHAAAQFGLKLWATLGEFYTENIEPTILREWAGLAGTRVLLTTRSNAVASDLDMPPNRLERLSPAEGAALVSERLGEANSAAAERLRGNLEALSTILGGHPLALALTSRQLAKNFNERRLKTVLAALAAGMASGEDFKDPQLDRGEDKVDSGSVTLKTTLDQLGGSAADLQARREAQFRALGVLPVRAAHLLALWDSEDYEAIDDFVTEGLLDPAPDPSQAGAFKDDQYMQHRLLRAYARSLLKRDAGELAAVQARHEQYVIALADAGFEKPPEEWGALEDDLPQIHALGNRLAAELAAAATMMDTLRADNPDLAALLEKAPMADAPPYVEIVTDTQGQRLAEADPDLDRRLYDLARTMPVGTMLASSVVAACSDFAKAVWGYILDRYVGLEGRRWLWAGLALALRRAVGDRGGAATTLYNMSYVVDPAEAISLVEKALKLWRDIQSPDVRDAARRLAELRGGA